MTLNLGTATPKQREFLDSTARYTAYGGARGGGKSHAMRLRAITGCASFPEIRILMVRRTYNELDSVIIQPLLNALAGAKSGKEAGWFTYHVTRREIRFANGSLIKFGHFGNSAAELEYQGQEFDWVMIDEATQLSERQFRILGACVRGSNALPKRMYLSANPGGIGHVWFKRLFVNSCYDKTENSADYIFIPATLDDNPYLGDNYAAMLDALPEDIRRAHRYGDWEFSAGRFFTEFTQELHTAKDFQIPDGWTRYRAFDYGLDCFACVWVAVDYQGRCYVYREVEREGLLVSEAAELMRQMTAPWERIVTTCAPPDMWSRQKDSGCTMAEIFITNGIALSRAPNSRVQGWLQVRERIREGMLIFQSCRALISSMNLIERSPRDPGDCAAEPHLLTHILDALRYYCAFRYIAPSEEFITPDDGRLAILNYTG
jgi:phage terminase large subunit